MRCDVRVRGRRPSGEIAAALWAGGIPADELAFDWGRDLQRALSEAEIDLILPLALLRKHSLAAVSRVASEWVIRAANDQSVTSPLIAAATSHAVDPYPVRDRCTATKQLLIQAAGKQHYHLNTAAAYVAGLAALRTAGFAIHARYEAFLVGHHLKQLYSSDADLFTAQSDFIGWAITFAKDELP